MSRGNPEDWKDRSIPQPDVVASQDAKFVKSFQQFTLDNPHPGYGKDPNIINEYGHTLYPKWITKPNGEKVIVQTPMEEKEVMGHSEDKLRDDGPTISEYVAAGYDPSKYPPKGYASKNSKEEIQAFIDKHSKTGW